MKSNTIQIDKIKISKNHKPLIIAEIGINHNGSLSLAKKIALDAINTGFKIIKHQTHIPEKEMSEDSKKMIPGNSKKSIYEIIKKCTLTEEDEFELCDFIRSKGGVYISTPFCREAVDRLERFKVPAFKIGSGECNNFPLIDYIARKKKPVILSTGMNNIKNIEIAVSILKKYKVKHVLLHCTNLYPTPYKLVRLGAINLLKKKFPNTLIGLSDHTQDNYSAYAALGLGAKVIEKHFIHKKKIKGPDIICSMDASEGKQLLDAADKIYLASGTGKGPVKEEKVTIKFAFSSVGIIKNINKNEILTKKNIFPIRSNSGYFKPKDYFKLLGKKAKKNLILGKKLKKGDFY